MKIQKKWTVLYFDRKMNWQILYWCVKSVGFIVILNKCCTYDIIKTCQSLYTVDRAEELAYILQVDSNAQRTKWVVCDEKQGKRKNQLINLYMFESKQAKVR